MNRIYFFFRCLLLFFFCSRLDPPRVGPYEFPNDLQVGMKARAMCSVMQGDPPFRFLWTQDSHRIEPDVPTSDTGAIFRTQHFRDYSMLTVDSLTLSHAGNITCIVSNDAGKTSQSSLLKVNGQWNLISLLRIIISNYSHTHSCT